MTSPNPTGDDRTPPLAQDLDSVQVKYTWNFGKGEGPVPTEVPIELPPMLDEAESLRQQVKQYITALEDIVTLALSSAEYKERAIMMHRRAVAALSGISIPKRDDSQR